MDIRGFFGKPKAPAGSKPAPAPAGSKPSEPEQSGKKRKAEGTAGATPDSKKPDSPPATVAPAPAKVPAKNENISPEAFFTLGASKRKLESESPASAAPPPAPKAPVAAVKPEPAPAPKAAKAEPKASPAKAAKAEPKAEPAKAEPSTKAEPAAKVAKSAPKASPPAAKAKAKAEPKAEPSAAAAAAAAPGPAIAKSVGAWYPGKKADAPPNAGFKRLPVGADGCLAGKTFVVTGAHARPVSSAACS
jgi:hypothetical protein